MHIDLSDADVVFIYGHFRKEANKLKEMKTAPNCPLSDKNMNQSIELYDSIADKFRDACPSLAKMDDYKL